MRKSQIIQSFSLVSNFQCFHFLDKFLLFWMFCLHLIKVILNANFETVESLSHRFQTGGFTENETWRHPSEKLKMMEKMRKYDRRKLHEENMLTEPEKAIAKIKNRIRGRNLTDFNTHRHNKLMFLLRKRFYSIRWHD